MISGLTPAARAATNSEESIVPCAWTVADVDRRCDDLGGEACRRSRVTDSIFGLADAAGQRLNQAFVVHQSDGVARAQLIELLLHARQLANARQVGQVQLELPEDAIQRVVAADDEFDGLPERLRHRHSCSIGSAVEIQAERVCLQRRRCKRGRFAIRQHVGDAAADQWQQQPGDEPSRMCGPARRRRDGFVVECDPGSAVTPSKSHL